MEHFHFEEWVEEQSKLSVLVEVGSIEIQPGNSRVVTIEAEARHMNVTVSRNENTLHVRAERDEAWRSEPRKMRWRFSDDPGAHLFAAAFLLQSKQVNHAAVWAAG